MAACEGEGADEKSSDKITQILTTDWPQWLAEKGDAATLAQLAGLNIPHDGVTYGAEAYPQLNDLSALVLRRLKEAQQALGEWHDAWQWLVQAEQQPDLQPCVEQWRAALVHGEKRADRALVKLSAACFQ